MRRSYRSAVAITITAASVFAVNTPAYGQGYCQEHTCEKLTAKFVPNNKDKKCVVVDANKDLELKFKYETELEESKNNKPYAIVDPTQEKFKTLLKEALKIKANNLQEEDFVNAKLSFDPKGKLITFLIPQAVVGKLNDKTPLAGQSDYQIAFKESFLIAEDGNVDDSSWYGVNLSGDADISGVDAQSEITSNSSLYSVNFCEDGTQIDPPPPPSSSTTSTTTSTTTTTTTTAPTTAPGPEPEDKFPPSGEILGKVIGGVAGSIFGLAILAAIFWKLMPKSAPAPTTHAPRTPVKGLVKGITK